MAFLLPALVWVVKWLVVTVLVGLVSRVLPFVAAWLLVANYDLVVERLKPLWGVVVDAVPGLDAELPATALVWIQVGNAWFPIGFALYLLVSLWVISSLVLLVKMVSKALGV